MLTPNSPATGAPARRVAALIAAVGLTLAVALPATAERKFSAQREGTSLAKLAGHPDPETVSPPRVFLLHRGALAAARTGVLNAEAHAYMINGADRHTLAAVPRPTAGRSYAQVKAQAEAYKVAHPGNGGREWDINAKTPAQLAADRPAARLLSVCGASQRPVIPVIAREQGGVDHQWINPSASALVYCVYTPVRNATSHWKYNAAASRVTADVYVKYPDQNPCRTRSGRNQVAACLGDVTNLEILVDTASLHDGAEAGLALADASTKLRLIMPNGSKVQLGLNI